MVRKHTDYESEFDRQLGRLKKEEAPSERKPARHKKQNVFLRGEVVKLTSSRAPLVHFDRKNQIYRRSAKSYDDLVLITLSDSDQQLVFEKDSIYTGFRPPYRMWPMLTLDGEIVWWVMDSRFCGEHEDPMRSLRGLFPTEFKRK